MKVFDLEGQTVNNTYGTLIGKANVPDDLEVGSLLKINGKFYSIKAISCAMDMVVVRGLNVDSISKSKCRRNKEYITCPYCGYEIEDSEDEWEWDDEHECEVCGGVFSYETVTTYSSSPVRPPDVHKVTLKECTVDGL